MNANERKCNERCCGFPTGRDGTGGRTPKRLCRLTSVLFAVCVALWVATRISEHGNGLLAADDSLPRIRRIFVPADRPDQWPNGDWQPIPLAELERQLDRAAAGRRRPPPFIERADYSATLVNGELNDARAEWYVRRPDSFLSLLAVGPMNLNVSQLFWSELARSELARSELARSDPDSKAATSKATPVPALWGTTPEGTTGIVVDRRQGRFVGEWSCLGRQLAASTEFDLELPPAATSRMTLKIPAGLILTSTTGEVSSTEATSEPGWNEWRVNFGSRAAARLRVATRADSSTARPLIIVRSNLNYVVRSEAVRLLAEFAVEPLETVLREVQLAVDPEIQVTSIEYGDGGAVAWQSSPTRDGRLIVVQLPDSSAGEGQTLRVQGIAQIKQFAAWTLPRIRVQGPVEDAGKVTLRIQPPLQAADIRADGYLQTELTTSAADGESLVFKQLRPDGTITIVPTDGKPDLACRVVTLVTSESNQWTLISQMEWKAAAGSTFAANCLIPELWEIVDVRLAQGENSATRSEWDVEEFGSGRRMLHMFFLNALAPDRPQRVRITARRLPPGPGEQAVMPPLIPSDAGEVEHFVVVTTGPESRPFVESASEIELLTIRDLPEEVRRIDFLSSRLSDRRAHFLAFKTLRSPAGARLRIEPFASAGVFGKHPDVLASQTVFTPNPPSEPESTSARSAASASLDLPVSLDVRVQVSGLSSGFDRYLASVRLAVGIDPPTLRWTLAEPAELIGATVGGRRVVPLARNGSYSIEALPETADRRQPADILVAEIEYRVPAAMHWGPNSRKLVLPVPTGPVLHFELDLVVPDRVRLTGLRLRDGASGLRLAGFDERYPWHRRLLGPFARPAGKPIFNPFSLASWSSLPGPVRAADQPSLARAADQHQEHERVWRSATASLPAGAEFVIWNADEATWLSIAALALCALASLFARLAQAPMQRGAAFFAIACLCFGALTLSQVEAEIAASALTGLVLAVLLPQRVLRFARRPDVRPVDEIPPEEFPVGSTQSFIPLAGIVLAGIVLGGGVFGLGLAAQAQDDRRPGANGESPAAKAARPILDVLIPVDSAGKPAGKTPLAYASADLLARLRRAAATTALPPYLIGSATFDGRVDESNQLLVLARFDVHILASEPVVRVHLPLGKVNLGGTDACLVDGRPHPLIAPPQGSGLLLELPGIPPAAAVPVVPESEPDPEGDRSVSPGTVVGEITDEPTPVRTYRVELRLHPPIDGGRADFSSALVTVPPGCQTQATLTSSVDYPVLGVIPTDATRSVASQRQAADGKPRIRPSQIRQGQIRPGQIRPGQIRPGPIRPGPTSQLMFFWSAIAGAGSQPPAEMQAGISCLADVSPALIQLRYHIAYHIQSGHADSLVWHVPAGYVLQSVQAPQLAGFRFRPGQDGGREMLLEFSRPQEEDFSLTATFALPIDRHVNPFKLLLLDPLRSEDGTQKNISLRFHQFALRQPSDLRVNISSSAPDHVLKPRPIKEFLKEWNAAGARPQQAFDLARLFMLQLDVESLPAQPSVRGSSQGHFRPGRLDWTYSAQIEQPLVGQFVYRLHVDPRLKIRAVSVQEDGAERLLRPSQLRETLVLLLNDKATRMQTLRIDASLPMSASQEIDLPRIRFAGATPGPERITLFRDADLAVRLANPEDFPLPPVALSSVPLSTGTEPEVNAGRDRLVARLDFLPEQANPRVQVEPVLPQITAETATIVESHAGSWQLTTCIRFHVISGRADTFTIDLPESLAARVEVRSIPTSRTKADLPVDGRITLVFHPDEPVGDQFVVVLTGRADLAGAAWQLPAFGLPGAEPTATILVVPSGLESVDAALQADSSAIPEWIKSIVPVAVTGPGWKTYRWPGAAPAAEFRATRDRSSKAGVDSARFDLWLEPDGSIKGWLGLNLSENLPSGLKLDWPHGAHPIALYVAGEFLALPAPESGGWTIPLPPSAKGGLVWLSWSDPRHSLPALSGPFAAGVPWPRNVPIEHCSVNIHSPPHFRIDAAPPFVATASRSQADALPALVSSADERYPSLDADISLAISPVSRPGAGPGVGFELGTALRVVNERPRKLWLSIAATLLVSALCWKTAPFWSWLTRHETSAWLVLSVIWCLWLDPSWIGPLLALWAIARALFRRDRPIAARGS